MNQHRKILFAFFALLLFGFSPEENKQKEITDPKKLTITLKKGQSIDLLSAIQKPNTQAQLNEYFAQVFPLAKQHGFQLNGSFIPATVPAQGNFQPSFFSLMSWPDAKARERFRKDANQLDYRYTEERKKIWSVFNLTEYNNIEKDVVLELRSDRLYAVSCFWLKDTGNYKKGGKARSKLMQQLKGKTLLVLGKGHSPKGYQYEPDVVSISEWPSMEAFNEFVAKTKGNEIGVSNANQWVTTVLIK